jgi:integrase
VASAQYLYRRESGIYFVRLCVPTRLKAAVGKGEIHRSTGCRDYRLAKIVAAELGAEWHQAIRALERMDIGKIKAGSLRLLGEGFMPLEEAASELGTSAATLAAELSSIQAPFSVEAKNWLGWSVENIRETLEHVFDELGQQEVVISESRLGGKGAQLRFTGRLTFRFPDEAVEIAQSPAPVGVCQFAVWPSKDRHFVCDLPGQPIRVGELEVRKSDVERLRGALASKVTPEMLAASVAEQSRTGTARSDSTSPTAVRGLRFSGFAEEYLARNKGLWKPDQQDRRRDQCDAFQQLMGDPMLSEITRHLMRQFGDRIARIPDERHIVRRKYKLDADFLELVQLADQHDLPRLTIQAQKRLLDGLAEIFSWAVAETFMPTNPAKGLGSDVERKSGATRIKAHEQRDEMAVEDLQKIMSASWYVNGHGERTAGGIYFSYRPHYYWLPLLALFTGGRLNELAQLYLADVKMTEGGTAYIDFNLEGADKINVDDPDRPAVADKSLKTISSARQIPIHKSLLEVGFFEYCAALREAGHVRLFPELRFDAKKGYGKAAGKWFNERFLGRSLKIARDGRKTFHSLRHNYATALGAAGVPTTVKSDLMGHARDLPLVEARYEKGALLAAMKMHIDKIDHKLLPIAKFSIADGLAAIDDALGLKVARKGRAGS